MSLRLRVMQRDGWPKPIPPHRGPWLWDCMPDTVLYLSVCDNQTPATPLTSFHQTLQINATQWCAVCQIHSLSNTPPTQKKWWERDSAWNGGNTHTQTHEHTRWPVPEMDHSIWCQTMSIFFVCCAIFLPGSPPPSLSPFLPLISLTCHDQMGSLRVQRLTCTPGGCSSITFPLLFQLAFFYHFIPPSPQHPFHHQQIRPFLFHPGQIVSVSFTFMWTIPPPPLLPAPHTSAPQGTITNWLRG